MFYLSKCCGAIANLAADAQTHYAMSAVHVRELPGGRWRVEATDGRVLGILRGRSNPTPDELHAAAALPDPESLTTAALLPAREFAKAMRSVAKDGRLGVLLGRPHVLLTTGEAVVRSTPEEGRFVDVESVLPKRPAPVSIRVNPDLLIDLLKAASAVARTGETASVELLWWGKGRPVGVTAKGASGMTFDGLIMPMD